MRLCHRIYLLIGFVVAICLFIGPTWADEAPSTGKAIASVNGKTISRSEYDRMVSVYEKRAAHTGKPLTEADLKTVKNRILENLINAELLYQQSQKEGIKIDEKTINERIGNMKKRFPNEDAYKQALKRMRISEKDFRSEIQRSLAISKLLYKERKNITVTDKEIETYYHNNLNSFRQPEQVKISQIFIKVKPGDEKTKKLQARKKIEVVQKKLAQGEDFGELAKSYSEGPNAKQGGAWGYIKRANVGKELGDVAFALKVGEVSKIFETPSGYHLIKVIAKKPAGPIPYKEVETMIKEHLITEKQKTAIQDYVKNLKKSADIKMF